ncbi:uncharacterized protein RMCFA_5716 [Mycolicibacterium fortuitum subsp. acetamidolyticum]|uniref:Uncharacterized protein n=1 Tax=Mycolicibacterium fortuitum subsp. acetamidolyticum TaxID=144550 RepID=A0A124E5A0_MYCFO|nr:hypothetical protein MFTT_09130 [Mycolicibacterium fortuitum subsp. fortuitum]GAT05605.1 uncharacterized protein RMCFA_5716 [Mycolicibacterium fortuitum subsp. acetamidolyticum]
MGRERNYSFSSPYAGITRSGSYGRRAYPSSQCARAHSRVWFAGPNLAQTDVEGYREPVNCQENVSDGDVVSRAL